MTLLAAGVIVAALWALLGLGNLLRWARGFGRRPLFAAPAGSPARGIRYAFTAGLAPGAKESVRLHLPSYLAGLVFHAGVFGSLVHLALRMAGHAPQGLGLAFLGALALAGTLCGAGLLVKRAVSSQLRGFTVPDDYLANGLSTVFTALTAATAGWASCYPWLQGSATALFLYVPLGKLRHSVFFFTTRAHFGAFFGRRGTFPPRG